MAAVLSQGKRLTREVGKICDFLIGKQKHSLVSVSYTHLTLPTN